MTNSSIDNYSKEGLVIGRLKLKISFMKKRLFPKDHINLLYQNQESVN